MSILTLRRAIRKYDQAVKIDRKEILTILEEATRAPSSKNMQPWRFFIVESKEAKEKLRPVLRGNQLQLETSAAMVLIFADLKKYEYAEKIYHKAVDLGFMTDEIRNKQLDNIKSMSLTIDENQAILGGMIDGGLVAMQLMHIAREHGYDTCPIGGFMRDKIADAMGIDSNRYKPVLIVSIGKAAEEGHPTVRLDIKEITTFM